MELGRLPDLLADTSGYIHKSILQGDGGGAMVHTPSSNPKYSLISFHY